MCANRNQNRHHLRPLACLGVVLAFNWGHTAAQTLDEITQLQRAKVVAELNKKEMGSAPSTPITAIAPVTGGVNARPTAGPLSAGAAVPEPPPSVVAIYGVAGQLIASVSVGGRPVRYREGEQTESGWMVQHITASGVQFARVTKDQSSTQSAGLHKTGRKGAASAGDKTVFVPWTPATAASPTGAQAVPAIPPIAGVSAMLPMPMATPVVPAPAPLPAATGAGAGNLGIVGSQP